MQYREQKLGTCTSRNPHHVEPLLCEPSTIHIIILLAQCSAVMSWTVARGVQDNYRPPLVAPEIVSPLHKACWHPTYPASLLQNPLVHGPLRIEGQGRGRHNPVHHCLLDIERHASSSNSAHTTVQKSVVGRKPRLGSSLQHTGDCGDFLFYQAEGLLPLGSAKRNRYSTHFKVHSLSARGAKLTSQSPKTKMENPMHSCNY